MNRALRLLAWVLVLATSNSFAAFHLFQIDQIYSNATGTVQFIVLFEPVPTPGEDQWGGQSLRASGPGGTQTYVFPSNLPKGATGGKRVLVATEGFAALGIVTPDFVVPNGFLAIGGGTINYADVDLVTYSALPTDGVSAVSRFGAVFQNRATNFAGESASVGAAIAPIVPLAGVWLNPAESGSGFGLDYKDGTLIVEAYSYLAGGGSQWYLAAGPVVNNVFTGTLDKYTGGQCISCAFKAPALVGNDGTITITFTSPTTATVDLPGGRHIQIQRYFQSAPVAGPFIPVPGAWLNPSESGSGFGLDYENGTLIVEVYSYLAGGASQWYLAAGPVNNHVFTGTLDKYTGGQCISCAYVAPGPPVGNDGTITITFTSATTATVDLPGNRHIQIQRFFQ